MEQGDSRSPRVNSVDNEIPLVKYNNGSELDSGKDALECESLVQSDRETWGKKVDFLLSVIGFAVDLANVWRFPYLCYKNGGGAFLIPYFLMLFFGACPLFYMELLLGQFHREGAISIWKIAPLLKGVGWASCIISFYVAFYYNVIIAWSVHYFIRSFTRTLPWTSCNHTWNTRACFEHDHTRNESLTNSTTNAWHNGNNISAATEYFERGVLKLHRSSGLDDLGSPDWQLLLCVFAVFTILYFSLWKGVKSSGKVVWVTATMPYVVLAILLIRGVLLPGAGRGIMFFITPRLERLQDPEVWIDAAVQIFYSVGAGFGAHLAYASYNKFNNNCFHDCISTAAVNSFTSLFSGFVIFSYLGHLAQLQGKDVQDVAAEGPGLVFVIYPEAIATLPGSVGWSIIFFIMLMTLGLDSAMGGLEATITGIMDEFRHFFKNYRFSREMFTGLVVLGAMICAIPNIAPGGMYVVTLLDQFAAGSALLLVVLCQAVGVAWVYGVPQFCADAEKMLGFQPGLYWRVCWKFITPVFLTVIIVSSVVSFKPLKYVSSMGTYNFPAWANNAGWGLSASTMILIPLVAAIQIIKTPGSLKQRIALNISPTWEHRAIQHGEPVKRFKLKHWMTLRGN